MRPSSSTRRSSGARAGLLREVLGTALAWVAVSVALTWPAAWHPRTTVPGDVGDPLLQAWQAAWGGHALGTAPGHVFDANAFWPLRRSLAFSDSLLGYAPFGLVGSGPAAALVRYNVLYVLAHAFAGFGAHLLARQLGVRSRLAAGVAGAAFAFAPWRITQVGHLHILSTGGIALSLALLLRGHRLGRGAVGWTLAGWLVAAWQLTLGFGIGLPFGYGLAVILLTAALLGARVTRPLLAAHLAGGAAFAATGLAMALPYLRVVQQHPEARRTIGDVALYSPPLRGFFTAPERDRLWGGLCRGARASLSWPPEMALGLGAAVVVLGIAGVVLADWSRRRRALLAAVAVFALLFGAGTTLAGGRLTYRLLLDHAPGWDAIRTPGRLVLFASLALGLLAAGAVDTLRRRAPWLPALALVAVLAEGLSTLAHPRPAPPPLALHAAPGPVLVLPSTQVGDTTVMWWSTAGFPQIVNGTSGFVPTELAALRAAATTFPDPASIAYLSARGVHSVVVPAGAPAPALPAGVPAARTGYGDGSTRYTLAGSD